MAVPEDDIPAWARALRHDPPKSNLSPSVAKWLGDYNATHDLGKDATGNSLNRIQTVVNTATNTPTPTTSGGSGSGVMDLFNGAVASITTTAVNAANNAVATVNAAGDILTTLVGKASGGAATDATNTVVNAAKDAGKIAVDAAKVLVATVPDPADAANAALASLRSAYDSAIKAAEKAALDGLATIKDHYNTAAEHAKAEVGAIVDFSNASLHDAGELIAQTGREAVKDVRDAYQSATSALGSLEHAIASLPQEIALLPELFGEGLMSGAKHLLEGWR